MRRYAGRIAFAVVCVVFFAVLIALFQRSLHIPAGSGKRVAVVLYGQSAERWRALDLGIAQAASELGIEKPVLSVRTAPGDDDAEEQLERIRREIATGADGVLVAACDSEALREALEALDEATPVLLVETGAGDSLPAVAPDDREMGRRLARRLRDAGHTEGILLLAAAPQRSSVAHRREGFLEEAEALGLGCTEAGPGAPYGSLTEAITKLRPAALVALDDESLEAAGSHNLEAGLPLYGVGAGSQVTHLLDRGAVTELCLPNEFAMGYTAMMQLAARLGLADGAAPPEVEFRHITRSNLYEPENERLVFPIIQ